MPFKRYRFYKRQQQPEEPFDQYVTALQQLADHCFASVVKVITLLSVYKKTYQKSVRTVDEYEASCSDDAVYEQQVSYVQPATDRFVMLKLRNSGNYRKFQLDTGPECNAVPLHLYKKATGDIKLSNVTPCNDAIVAFGCTKLILSG